MRKPHLEAVQASCAIHLRIEPHLTRMTSHFFSRQPPQALNQQRPERESGPKLGPYLGIYLGLLAPALLHAQTATLGTTNLVEGSAAGVDAVLLNIPSSTNSWTATVNAPWLHLSAGSNQGVGTTHVLFGWDANPGGTRIGTLTVAGLTLTVTQVGSAYVPASAVTLVSSGLNYPQGVGVDLAGNVYIADERHSAIKKWSPVSDTLSTLIGSGLVNPQGLAVDAEGNVFFTDRGNNTVNEWAVATGIVTNLVSAGLNKPSGVALDPAGDLYIIQGPHDDLLKWSAGVLTTIASSGLYFPNGIASDTFGNLYLSTTNNSILELSVASGATNTLVETNLNAPAGIAVGGGGNLFFADSANGAIKTWNAFSHRVNTLVSGLGRPAGVAVDGKGNVFFADALNNRVAELPRAFVNPTPRFQAGNAGSDALPPVWPSAVIQSAIFGPISDSPSWLSITGVTNGVISYSFTANPSAITHRTGHLVVLGQKIPVTQLGRSSAPPITGELIDGAVQVSFTGNPGASYSVLASTNVELPVSAWTLAGIASEIAPGQFRFTNAPSSETSQFFQVRTP